MTTQQYRGVLWTLCAVCIVLMLLIGVDWSYPPTTLVHETDHNGMVTADGPAHASAEASKPSSGDAFRREKGLGPAPVFPRADKQRNDIRPRRWLRPGGLDV
jgi:hypothetical protein